MQINAALTSRRWFWIGVSVAFITLFFEGVCAADERLKCDPAVEGTIGSGIGLPLFPGGAPLLPYGFTEAQGSLCGFSLGASASRGGHDFDQRFFGSYTYTLGYADFSGGFVLSETKNSPYVKNDAERLNSTILRRDRFFVATGFHPTKQSEVSARWAKDVKDRDWSLRFNGIYKLWASPEQRVEAYFDFERVKENEQFRLFGGDLITFGVRFRQKINRALSLYADVGSIHAAGVGDRVPKQTAVFRLGIIFGHGYHDSTDIGHIGIRDH